MTTEQDEEEEKRKKKTTENTEKHGTDDPLTDRISNTISLHPLWGGKLKLVL